MTSDDLRVLIIAGPNGAGKTTFANEFLPQEAGCPVFINADLIAAGISPFDADREGIQAGRLMLNEISRHFAARESFAFETTLAGRGYARLIPQWRAAGYKAKLLFLRLNNPEEAIARVAERVRQGGHDIPEAVIRRRFHAGWKNLKTIYTPIVDYWAIYDNSGRLPEAIDWSTRHE
ncbi:MAG: zeta toxin family protein [Gammaproteobacteria bacterium]|nr:zeta toxin family protein [Nitrococcus sp.]MDN5863768.1 zeta toxin family protein [Gammaproteobacteria bacterium]